MEGADFGTRINGDLYFASYMYFLLHGSSGSILPVINIP